MNDNLLWYYSLYLPPLMAICSYLTQIRLNYRLHSTDGLSSFYLYLIHIGMGCMVLYHYFLDLPWPLISTIVVIMGLIYVLVGQHIAYAPGVSLFSKRLQIHSMFFVSFVGAFIAGFFYPQVVGHTAGWIGLVVFSCIHLPQIYKNYVRKSVEGLSIGTILFSLAGTVLCIIQWFVFGLPLQTLLKSIRGLLYLTFSLGQFIYYKRQALMKSSK